MTEEQQETAVKADRVKLADFVAEWNAAMTIKEVSEKLGRNIQTLSVRASQLRKRGVLLKKFKRVAAK